MQTVIVLFNLKPGVDREAYETWARSSDLPVVNGLPSVDKFEVLMASGLLIGEGTSALLSVAGKESKRINFRTENDYKRMLEHFYNVAVSKDVPRFPLSDAINNLVVLDALFQSAVDNGRLINIK